MQFFWNNINITMQTIFNIKNPQKFLIPIIWPYQKNELQVSAVVYIFKRGKKEKKNRLSVLITITSIMMDSTQINDE